MLTTIGAFLNRLAVNGERCGDYVTALHRLRS
jgi:hypothetical protein